MTHVCYCKKWPGCSPEFERARNESRVLLFIVGRENDRGGFVARVEQYRLAFIFNERSACVLRALTWGILRGHVETTCSYQRRLHFDRRNHADDASNDAMPRRERVRYMSTRARERSKVYYRRGFFSMTSFSGRSRYEKIETRATYM